MSKLRIKRRKKLGTPEEHAEELGQFSGNFDILVVVPVPTFDHKVCAALSNFLSGVSARHIGLVRLIDGRNPENARNAMIDKFLYDDDYKKHTHILFVDADTCPLNPYALEKLLIADKPIISGITPVLWRQNQQTGMFWNVRIPDKPRNLWLNEVPETGLFKAEYVGASFMLCRRDALEKLSKPYMKLEYDFECIQFKKGEDYYFCEKLRDAGFDIWIDPEVQCHHYHYMDMMEIIQMLSRYGEQNSEEVAVLKERIEELEKLLNAAA